MASVFRVSCPTSSYSHSSIPFEQYALFASIRVHLDALKDNKDFDPEEFDPSCNLESSIIFSSLYPLTVFICISKKTSPSLSDFGEKEPIEGVFRVGKVGKDITTNLSCLFNENAGRALGPMEKKTFSISRSCPPTSSLSPRILKEALPHFNPQYGLAKIRFRPTEKTLIFEVTLPSGHIEYMDMAQAKAMLARLMSIDGYIDPSFPYKPWHLS